MSDSVSSPQEKQHRGLPWWRTFGVLRRRLRRRPDTEHETTFNRLALNLLALIYFAIDDAFGWSTAGGGTASAHFTFGYATMIACFYLVVALGFFGHILWKPAVSPIRRVAAMVADVSFITYVMHIGGERFLWCYPFLLWAIFGNGFRFGARYLFIASGLATAAFAMLIIFNPFWQRYPALSLGCLLGLIVLPAYMSLLIRKLSEAIELAETANRAKSLFLASVSHELRTPLNAIIGLSDLMSVTKLNAEQSDMTRTIGEAGRSLLSLINSVLDLSRLEVGKMPMTEEKIDLYALLNRIRNITGVIAEKKGVRTCLQITPDVPQFIKASERQLDEVVSNLASNAVKFTEHGYVMICVSAERLSANSVKLLIDVKDTGIGIAEAAKKTIFDRFIQADETIVDRFGGTGLGLAIAKQMVEQRGGSISVDSKLGAGSTFRVEMTFETIDEELAAPAIDRAVIALTRDQHLIENLQTCVPAIIVTGQVVEAAERLRQSNDPNKGKPVLICDLDCPGDTFALAQLLSGDGAQGGSFRTIAVNRHGNDIIDDTLGQYFSSIIESPVTYEAINAAMRIAMPTRANRDADGKTIDIFHAETSGHILVADDNKTNQKVIGKILERAGHKVTFADNGEIALNLLSRGNFDLAFMDINMPVLNGLEATRLYKFSSLGQTSIPIYALTADVTEETRNKASDAGMHGCLSKPIEPSKLLAVVDEQIIAAGGPVVAAAGTLTQEQPDEVAAAETGADENETDHGPIDRIALDDLAQLGGDDFVREVIDQFVDDLVGILQGLSRAVEAQNYRAFRDDLHALRSGAANVGARNVFQFCLKWREIDPQELARCGDSHLQTLRDELEQARVLLVKHIDHELKHSPGAEPLTRQA